MQLAATLNGGFQPKRYRPGGTGNWSGHLPFAADLIAAVKPKLLVELGTHCGESYFGFCQAVRENDVACSCYAVNTWGTDGDEGSCQESAFRNVSAYNSAHYSDFSYLLRSTFDEAATKFSDESIDILHIQGLRTYQAVSHDFRSWLTKVKPGGIVLIHEVMVREADFGVWKLWEELAASSRHFVFKHNWGLGVFRKAGSAVPDNKLFDLIFDAPGDTTEHVRKFYALCAVKLEHEHENRNHDLSAREIPARVYPFGNAGYSDETAIQVNVKAGGWEHLSIDLIPGVGNGPLRLDPAEQPALIDLSGIVLRRPTDGEMLWSLKGSDELASLSVGGTLTRAGHSERRDFSRFFSYGLDPQLLLPALDVRRFDQPLILELWLRIQTDMASLLPMLQDADEQRSRNQVLEAALKESQASSVANTQSNSAELTALKQERDMLAGQHEALLSSVRRLQADLYVCKTDLKHKHADEARLRTEEDQLRAEVEREQQKLAAAERVLHEALTSRSWRITKPIRTISRAIGTQR